MRERNCLDGRAGPYVEDRRKNDGVTRVFILKLLGALEEVGWEGMEVRRKGGDSFWLTSESHQCVASAGGAQEYDGLVGGGEESKKASLSVGGTDSMKKRNSNSGK